MKALQFFKTSPMFDTYEIVRQCARCGEFDRHSDTCLELEFEQLRLDQEIRFAQLRAEDNGGER